MPKKIFRFAPSRRHTFKGERVTSSMKGRYPSSPPTFRPGLKISDLCVCTSHEGGCPITNSTTPPPWVSQACKACAACAQASAPQTLRRAFSFFFFLSSPPPPPVLINHLVRSLRHKIAGRKQVMKCFRNLHGREPPADALISCCPRCLFRRVEWRPAFQRAAR